MVGIFTMNMVHNGSRIGYTIGTWAHSHFWSADDMAQDVQILLTIP